MAACIAPFTQMDEHRYLLADQVCQDLYRKAIFQTVRKGDVVLDLGTGTGIHALFACQAGAKRVYAIESETVIEIAKTVARDNGYADRITFVYGRSEAVTLPEKVDVIITNTGFIGCMKSLPDACARFLKPGGRVIPDSAALSFVPAAAQQYYDDTIATWTKSRYGLKFDAFLPYAANYPHVSHFTGKEFLAEPVEVSPIDFTKPIPAAYRWRVDFDLERSGALGGLLAWYTFHLADGITMSARPPLQLSPKLWYQPFLPVSAPRKLRKGAHVSAELDFFPEATLDGAVWNWRIHADGATLEQTSFDSVPLSFELLAKLKLKH